MEILRADPAADLGGVVEDGAQRHASDELDHALEPLADALRGLAPENLGEPDVGVGNETTRKWPRVTTPRTRKSAWPKSTWHSPGSQSSRRNPCASRASSPAASSLAPAPHVPSDRRVGALEPLLRDEAVVDPLRGMALLAPAAPVFQEPRVDQGLEGLEQGDPGAPPISGGLSERSCSRRYFPDRGLGDPGVPGDRGDARAVPPEPSDIVDLCPRRSFPFPASNRRNRSNDNGRPNGMVGVPALITETFRAHIRNITVLEPTSQRLTNTFREAPTRT